MVSKSGMPAGGKVVCRRAVSSTRNRYWCGSSGGGTAASATRDVPLHIAQYARRRRSVHDAAYGARSPVGGGMALPLVRAACANITQR